MGRQYGRVDEATEAVKQWMPDFEVLHLALFQGAMTCVSAIAWRRSSGMLLIPSHELT